MTKKRERDRIYSDWGNVNGGWFGAFVLLALLAAIVGLALLLGL